MVAPSHVSRSWDLYTAIMLSDRLHSLWGISTVASLVISSPLLLPVASFTIVYSSSSLSVLYVETQLPFN